MAEGIVQHREAIRLEPDNAHNIDNLAWALRDQGKLDEAIAEWRKASRLKPDEAGYHLRLARYLRMQGKLDEAIAECREATRVQPGDAEAHSSLAWTLVVSPRRQRREYDEAVMHVRKAIELEPKDEQDFYILEVAEYRAGHWAESIAAGGRAMELGNGGSAGEWFFLAMAHWQKAEKGDARKWFDKAVPWTKEKDSNNLELRQFWSEAAELLGQSGPDASRPGSPPAPAVENPQ